MLDLNDRFEFRPSSSSLSTVVLREKKRFNVYYFKFPLFEYIE